MHYIKPDYTYAYILGALFGFIICGFITSAIISGKGRQNSGAWFWCGFFLGIIGIIIAACQTNLNYVNNGQNNTNSYQPDVRNSTRSIKDDLVELDELFDCGLITKGEYDTRRLKILNRH